MAGARGLVAGLALAGALWAGCADASAQQAKRVEHGMLEVSKLRLAHEDVKRVVWATATTDITVQSMIALWDQLGIKAEAGAPGSGTARVLDHLARQGWEVIDRTDVSAVMAGGTGISERYLLRRVK